MFQLEEAKKEITEKLEKNCSYLVFKKILAEDWYCGILAVLRFAK